MDTKTIRERVRARGLATVCDDDILALCDALDRARAERDAAVTKAKNVGADAIRMMGEITKIEVLLGTADDEVVDVVDAVRDAVELRDGWRSECERARTERDAAIALAETAERERDEALSGESDAVRRAESAELGCEIAYRREPTQAEGDAHEDAYDHDCDDDDCQRCAHLTPLGIKSGECFVPMGGWTGRRCRRCRRWVWGGPTACDACAAFEAGQERAEAAERERDARPEITPEDAARYIAWRSGFAPHPSNFDRLQPIDDALRAHAAKAVRP